MYVHPRFTLETRGHGIHEWSINLIAGTFSFHLLARPARKIKLIYNLFEDRDNFWERQLPNDINSLMAANPVLQPKTLSDWRILNSF